MNPPRLSGIFPIFSRLPQTPIVWWWITLRRGGVLVAPLFGGISMIGSVGSGFVS